MAKILLPGEMKRTSIIVQTRRGNTVDNLQMWSLTPFYLSQVRDWERRFPPPTANHGPVASPVYNCHGLTFASRRTAISDPADIARILGEDDYDEVADLAQVRPGDIAVYYSESDAEHSGIVIENDGKIPKVLSKWGLGKEVIHWLHQCPYDHSSVKYYRVVR